MNSLHRRKQLARRKPVLTVLVVGLLITIMIVLYVASPHFITGVVHSGARPVITAGNWIFQSLSVPVSYFYSKQKLVQENKRLRQELMLHTISQKQLSVVKSQNKRFKKMWGQSTSTHGILGAVLTRPPHSPYDMITLDIGRENGVEVGDSVIRANVSLGTIVEVYPSTSVARLYATSDVTTEGFLESRDLLLELTGTGNGSFRATAPKDISIEKGGIVSDPGRKPLVIAEVVAVQSQANDPQQIVLLQSPVTVTSLRFMQVINRSNND